MSHFEDRSPAIAGRGFGGRRPALSRLACGAATGLLTLSLLFAGCIGSKPADPAATQPVTAVDPAASQPSYWLDQPAVAQVRGTDFDKLWDACKTLARDYLFALDREDYRAGIITTVPMVSKQLLEVWRPDTGTVYEAVANSVATLRRTLRFDVTRDANNSFCVTPRVLIERQAIVERRVTSVVQYRTAFSGPRTLAKYAVRTEDEPADLPMKYWYPIGRDTEMEKQVARRLAKRLDGAAVATAAQPVKESPASPAPAAGLMAPDGAVASVGASETVYINLGSAQKVVPGMTFEVYDGRATVPPLEHYGKDNTGSRGWIEVVKVAGSSSTCRMIQKNPGATIAPGDLLFNFIYDRRGEQHFALAGEFEHADRETISGLIWRWNAQVDDQVGPGTHCLIAGRPPRDPAGKAAYDAARANAQERKIPVIDEERFNTLVRHYNPAQR